MGLSVELVDKDGFGVGFAATREPRNLAPIVAAVERSDLPLGVLGQIDQHGVTLLNAKQARVLSKDLDALRRTSSLPEWMLADLALLEEYVQRCMEEPHTFLEFIGD